MCALNIKLIQYCTFHVCSLRIKCLITSLTIFLYIFFMTRMDLFTLDFYWTKLNLKLAEQTFILKSCRIKPANVYTQIMLY